MCKQNSVMDGNWEELVEVVSNKLLEAAAVSKIFVANVEKGLLFEFLLRSLPAGKRQEFNCNACKSFLDNVGSLVTINAKGETTSVFWTLDTAKEFPFFETFITKAKGLVETSKVKSPYITDKYFEGSKGVSPYVHFYTPVPLSCRNNNSGKTAGEVRAEKVEELALLTRTVNEVTSDAVSLAAEILNIENFSRGDKFLSMAQWLVQVKSSFERSSGVGRKLGVMWLAVMNAPAGFTHIKNTVVGDMIYGIMEGKSIATVKHEFHAKLNGLTYQRPQVLPSSGNVLRAERLMEQLGISERDLERKFADIDDVKLIWEPKTSKPSASATGLFKNVRTRNYRGSEQLEIDLEVEKMTAVKFINKVLPMTTQIELNVKDEPAPFAAFTKAASEGTTPILKWDTLENRNTFSWYQYHKGSKPVKWGLPTGWVQVTGITTDPSGWSSGKTNDIVLLLEGASDVHYKSGYSNGSALFPEALRSDLREIRATIEEYSMDGTIHPSDYGNDACGLRISSSSKNTSVIIRYKTKAGILRTVEIDRWE